MCRLKNSGHSGSGTDKHHYTDLPIPSLTAEDIEEIHKIPEKEFQAIVKKKLQEFQNSNPTDSSSPLHASSLLSITDNRLGINEGFGIDEDAIIIENDGGEPDKLEGLEDSTFEIVSSSSISNSSLALDQILPLSTNSSILDKIVPTVVQMRAPATCTTTDSQLQLWIPLSIVYGGLRCSLVNGLVAP